MPTQTVASSSTTQAVESSNFDFNFVDSLESLEPFSLYDETTSTFNNITDDFLSFFPSNEVSVPSDIDQFSGQSMLSMPSSTSTPGSQEQGLIDPRFLHMVPQSANDLSFASSLDLHTGAAPSLSRSEPDQLTALPSADGSVGADLPRKRFRPHQSLQTDSDKEDDSENVRRRKAAASFRASLAMRSLPVSVVHLCTSIIY